MRRSLFAYSMPFLSSWVDTVYLGVTSITKLFRMPCPYMALIACERKSNHNSLLLTLITLFWHWSTTTFGIRWCYLLCKAEHYWCKMHLICMTLFIIYYSWCGTNIYRVVNNSGPVPSQVVISGYLLSGGFIDRNSAQSIRDTIHSERSNETNCTAFGSDLHRNWFYEWW